MSDSKFFIALLLACGIVVLGLVGGGCFAYLQYKIYYSSHSGQAKLREAEHSRKVRIEEAKAKLESAKFESQAEVERAKGVAEANKIIGDSLKGNDAYLRYLWIQGLQDGSSETIYIPIEANLPILEATRRDEEKVER